MADILDDGVIDEIVPDAPTDPVVDILDEMMANLEDRLDNLQKSITDLTGMIHKDEKKEVEDKKAAIEAKKINKSKEVVWK